MNSAPLSEEKITPRLVVAGRGINHSFGTVQYPTRQPKEVRITGDQEMLTNLRRKMRLDYNLRDKKEQRNWRLSYHA